MGRYCKVILVLLLAVGIPCSQFAALAESHSPNHSSHCCGICHAGHLTVLQAAERFGFLPSTCLSWYRPAEEVSRAVDLSVDAGHSRAPPA